LTRRGEQVGLLKVRLFRPFPTEQLISALPASARRIAVLDRTKEPGALADPLYLDVVSALYEAGRRDVDVVAGRYGLGSKEFTPPMVKAVFDELALPRPRHRLTIGILDDVTGTSVTPDARFHVPSRAVEAVFFGLGSDGTVGANKAGIKLIGELTDLHAQGYFVYDSRKSGSVTVSHLRFGPDPIRSTYLVEQADFVACHQFNLLRTENVLGAARPGGTFLLNAPYPTDEVWDRLPASVRREIVDKQLNVWVINAGKVARRAGMGNRINTVMQPCFFALSNVIPRDEALEALKKSIAHTYAKRGPIVVQRNLDAVSRALDELVHLDIPLDGVIDDAEAARAIDEAPALTRELVLGHGNQLPVSGLPLDGVFPTGTAQWEKRSIATELPIWDPSICIDCGKCAIVCPHAAIRVKAYDPAVLHDAPDGFKSKDCMGRDLPGMKLSVQVSPDDCTGCGLCVEICPAHSKEMVKHKSINLEDALTHRDAERPNWDFFASIPEFDRTTARMDTVKGSQLLQPLFEFSGACAGCGETPYLKLISQLFGDRMVVANATGCSSIYGGNLPTTPWTQDSEGRGPAWANSLFEDNAEFGLGLRLAYERHAQDARRLLSEVRQQVGDELASAILEADQSSEAGIREQRARVARLKTALRETDAAAHDEMVVRLLSLADELVDKSFWIVGGDGWAYDIGFGGLDHVLGSGRNVNVLVLDTEVYSNTGGQASKATPRGAVAKFAASGKSTAKKDLGAFARSYGDVYVAQIALGANEMQTVRALREAAAWPGPSLVIAYSTCIAHGIEMSTSMTHQKDAVSAGYWPLYRYHPSPAPGTRPFQLDSKPPTKPLVDFVSAETRFAILQRTEPERAAHLLALAQSDVDERWRYYEGLADVARVLPHEDGRFTVTETAETVAIGDGKEAS
jgi:pyruvate-ferredoxin/flavodoxin oxidoreductase